MSWGNSALPAVPNDLRSSFLGPEIRLHGGGSDGVARARTSNTGRRAHGSSTRRFALSTTIPDVCLLFTFRSCVDPLEQLLICQSLITPQRTGYRANIKLCLRFRKVFYEMIRLKIPAATLVQQRSLFCSHLALDFKIMENREEGGCSLHY